MTAIPFLNNDTRLFVARNMGMYWAAYMMGIMFILSMCLMVFGLVAIISAIFFKVKFIYMLLMGGRKYEISPEDHIFAAVQIFLDIVYIFWMLLSLFGSSK
ncbi:hypothetical protein TELCIR_08638 [Teladorsagia circumcincta]|uniref:Uncharacterized protein n=1 Tax=Teladorsagia circumcincta TaxID=45464 RepID=A0A2G9UII2_TELCI|nr:hypothetical protein TELCIR_08638 [Teladorsagia circumcincta]